MRLGPGVAACLTLAACGGEEARRTDSGGNTASPAVETAANAPIGELRPDLKQAARSYPTDSAEIGTLIDGSADIARHRAAFHKATRELLASKRCSAADFQAQGGWMKSAMEHPREPVYFIYCGGAMAEHRVYLNVETGKLFS